MRDRDGGDEATEMIEATILADNIPAELKALPQWVPWKEIERDGRETKPPFRIDGTLGDSTDPDAWSPFDDALAAYQEGSHGFEGIGFTFSVYDPYAGVDLDGCRDPKTGEIAAWAWEIIQGLNSYSEVSPSGEGVHIIVKGRVPGDRNRKGDVEMYDKERYFTFTGHLVEGTRPTIERRQEQLAVFYDATFPQESKPAPAPSQAVSLDDAELLRRAIAAKNGDAFQRLWKGDTSEYPSPSEADLALCSHLAFWTGGDAARIDRLFRLSKLYRPKWDERHGADTYGDMTIRKALEGVTGLRSAAQPPPRNGSGLSAAVSLLQSLPFRTAKELSALSPERTDWVVEGLLARGGITELDSKVKAGKTTFLLAMIKALLSGEPFLGRATQVTPVVYLTEERAPSFRTALERVGMAHEDRIHILSRTEVPSALPWAQVVAQAAQYARLVGAGVLVVDTLARWSGLKDDSENNAGAAGEAMDPVESAAANGLAIQIARHDRKSGGEVGDSGRGSSAFSGAADIVLALRRADAEGHPSRRILLGVGRFEGVPEQLVIELRDGQYVALGDSADVERNEARGKLLDVLKGPEAAPGYMLSELVDKGVGKRSTLRRALKDLVDAGDVLEHSGAGKTRRGKGYTLSEDNQHSTLREGAGMSPFPHVPESDVPKAHPRGTSPGHKPLESDDSRVNSPRGPLLSVGTRPGKEGVQVGANEHPDAQGETEGPSPPSKGEDKELREWRR